ncbi:MAG: outer membrane beta-barrel protein [Oceanicoccus sp.]
MKYWTHAMGILSLAFAITQAQAQSYHPQMGVTHTFTLGSFYQDADGSVRSAANGQPGKAIDLGDLGVTDDYSSWLLDYSYRPNENWRFSAGAYTFHGDGTRTMSSDIDFGGVEFPVGSRVDTDLEVNTYMADAMYRVYGSERAEIFIGGGFHVLDVTIDLSRDKSIGENTSSRSRSIEDLTAPLPNLRMQAFYALSPKWAVSGTVGWLSLEYGDSEGAFHYVRARTSYRLTERFDIGLGYQYIDVDFTRGRSRGDLGLDAQFRGPSLTTTYSF